MLAIGRIVTIAPTATKLLTNASFAAGAPRVMNENQETIAPYATKNEKA
jgi:hypothetical protein